MQFSANRNCKVKQLLRNYKVAILLMEPIFLGNFRVHKMLNITNSIILLETCLSEGKAVGHVPSEKSNSWKKLNNFSLFTDFGQISD